MSRRIGEFCAAGRFLPVLPQSVVYYRKCAGKWLQKPSWKGEIEYERVLYRRRRHSAHAKLDMPEEKEKCPLVIVFHGLTGNMEERHITAVSSAMNEIGFATLRV